MGWLSVFLHVPPFRRHHHRTHEPNSGSVQEDACAPPLVSSKSWPSLSHHKFPVNYTVLFRTGEKKLALRGECMVQTKSNRCLVSNFDYRVKPWETVRWQAEEVDWGSYVSWEEVRKKKTVLLPPIHQQHVLYHLDCLVPIYVGRYVRTVCLSVSCPVVSWKILGTECGFHIFHVR